MPEGHSTLLHELGNQARMTGIEDFLTHDLIADAESGLPPQIDRSSRFILGNSMGGFAAIVVAFKHPDLYAFAGALPVHRLTTRRGGLRCAVFLSHLESARSSAPRGAARVLTTTLLCWQRRPRRVRLLSSLYLWAIKKVCAHPWSDSIAFLRREASRTFLCSGRGGHNWEQWNNDLPFATPVA